MAFRASYCYLYENFGTMESIDSLQIGHSCEKGDEFKIQCHTTDHSNIEVPFSHKHAFYAIYWIHQGSGTHVIDFENYSIIPNRLFFIKPEQIHFLHSTKSVEYSAIQFTQNFILPILNTMQRLSFQRPLATYSDLNEQEQKRLSTLFEQIAIESRSSLPNSTLLIQSELNTLLLEWARLSLPHAKPDAFPLLLLKYKDLIEQRFSVQRQVRYYAAQLGVTPNYLNILTQKHCNKSALALINDRVILEAKRLLVRSDKDITEIAYLVGFNELSYFSKFFRQHTDSTPIQFRNKMNKMYQD